MTDPIKKFGDAALARRVVAEIAEQPGDLSQDWCSPLGLDDQKCRLVQKATSNSSLYADLEITPEEKAALKGQGFSQEFIDEFSGPDGKRVLNARVKWLQNHIGTRFWRKDFNELIRRNWILDLGHLRGSAKSAIPYIIEAGREMDLVDYEVVDSILNIESDEFAQFYYLGQFCNDSEEGLRGLIKGMEESDNKIFFCSSTVLRAMGRKSKGAVPTLIAQYQKNENTISAEHRRINILGTIGSVAEPTKEVLDFFEEVAQKEGVNYRGLWDSVIALGPAAIPLLLKLLTSYETDRAVKNYVRMSFGKTPEGLAAVFEALDNDNKKISEEALGAIAQFTFQSPANQWMKLIPYLEDPSPEIRKKAALALGVQGEQAKLALPLLVTMRLNDEKEKCRVAAKAAIEAIEEKIL